MKRIFLPLFIAAIVVSACGKDDSAPSENRTQILVSAPWKYDTAGIDADGNGEIDTAIPSNMLESCELDNTIKFNADGTGVVDEGPTKCSDSNPQTANFTWSFNTSQNVITFSNSIFPGLTGPVDVRSITHDNLVLSKQVEVGFPIPVTVIVKLKH